MISIGASKRWPYSSSCAAWKRSFSSSTQASSTVAGRHLGAHLVSLPGVAAVGEPSHEAAVVRDGVGVELCDGLRDELVEARSESCALSRLLSAWRSVADELVLEIGREQPGRGEDARVRRHEHARDLELERDVAREQRPRAAGGDERELARVVAAPHRVELDRLGHPVLLDLQGAERRLLDRHPELVRRSCSSPARQGRGRAASRRRAARGRSAGGRARAARPSRSAACRRARSRPAPGRRRRTGARRGTRRPGRRRRSSRRRRRSCRCRPSAPSPGSRRSSCRAGGACAAGRRRRRRCRPRCRRCRA